MAGAGPLEVLDLVAQLRDAEVEHLDEVVAAVSVEGAVDQHDVFGLHVAVHHPNLVGGGERLRDLAGDSHDARDWQGAGFDDLLEARAPQVLHHAPDMACFSVVDEVVNLDDVGVLHQVDRAGLLQKTGDVHVDGGELFAKHFDRDLAIEREVPGEIDLAHAALADLFEQLVAAQDRGVVGQERPLPNVLDRRGDVGRRLVISLGEHVEQRLANRSH